MQELGNVVNVHLLDEIIHLVAVSARAPSIIHSLVDLKKPGLEHVKGEYRLVTFIMNLLQVTVRLLVPLVIGGVTIIMCHERKCCLSTIRVAMMKVYPRGSRSVNGEVPQSIIYQFIILFIVRSRQCDLVLIDLFRCGVNRLSFRTNDIG